MSFDEYKEETEKFLGEKLKEHEVWLVVRDSCNGVSPEDCSAFIKAINTKFSPK